MTVFRTATLGTFFFAFHAGAKELIIPIRRLRSRSKLSDRLNAHGQAIGRTKKFHNLLMSRSSQSIVFKSEE